MNTATVSESTATDPMPWVERLAADGGVEVRITRRDALNIVDALQQCMGIWMTWENGMMPETAVYLAKLSRLMPTFDGALPPVQHPLAQQGETCTAKHLAFERLELVHKSLDLAVAPL
jgi:hypothetical protein